MSLSILSILIAQVRQKLHKYREKKLSLLKMNSKRIPSIQYPNIEKRHLCAPSFYGSYTVEAAVVLPIFLSLMIFTIFYMRILQVEYGIQKALDQVGQQIAVVSTKEEAPSLTELCLLCEGKMISDKVPLGYVKGGALGISFQNSQLDGNYIDIQVTYDIAFPIAFFGKLQWHRTQQSVNRKWIGWDSSEEGIDGDYVYVTKYGEAYHLHRQCPYLNPSISAISYREVKDKRNHSGARYKACRGCGAKKVKSGVVYITQYGDVYHKSLGCIGLRRTIHRIPLTKVGERRLCEKCK